uniref:Drought induced 19 protein type zinc-binding domain-containing protein n=1 Tax=Daucus carota subsp. sativus TaxID=79200 RepID=A0A175YN14_DAUCS
MPEDPQQPKNRVPVGDLSEGFKFSDEKRRESVERFKNKKRLRTIAECSECIEDDDSDLSEDENASVTSLQEMLIAEEDEEEDEDDDDGTGYPCPYCYEEFDFIPLCHHLEHEHYTQTAETICTICAENVSGDMLPIQQNRLRKIPYPTSQELSLLGRDMREARLKTLLAGKGKQQSSSGASGSLLSSVLYPAPAVDEISKLVISCAEESSKAVEPPQPIWQSSLDPSLSSEERERRKRQAAGKAAFVRSLVFSTMFED